MKEKIKDLTENITRYQKLKIAGLVIKAVFGTVGSAVILTEKHPYLALIILGIGAGANEFVSALKDIEAAKENKTA